MDNDKKELLKGLPKIDELMLLLEKKNLFERLPKDIAKETCRSYVEELRQKILQPEGKKDIRLPTVAQAVVQLTGILERFTQYRLRRVVNATGVILHTNLGRAPLCREALDRLLEIGGGYSNLEFDLIKGERGLRYDHIRKILCALTGAEEALVVNNNAAAVLLALNTLATGKEVIVSRGELIEIGGEFRIPEVMEKSGTKLREVGTTNRTRLKDYEKAINAETALILKVHTSNFKIVGFTEDTDITDLVTLGRKYGIPVMDDLGSGCLIELDHYGLEREPTVRDILSAGTGVVTFSGDKLLGGPQAGLILGRREIMERVKQNPLNRALRIDKLTLAALEATLIHYLQPATAVRQLPGLKALTEPLADVIKRAKKLHARLKRSLPEGFVLSLKTGSSMAGGGSLPTQEIPTALIGIRPGHMTASHLEERLRQLDTPIVARIADEEVLFDLRTINEQDFPIIQDGLKRIIVS